MTATPREAFLAALDRRPPIPGRVPHFELEVFLTMEALGRVHPLHRRFDQWDQMTERERALHRRDVADLYVKKLRRFGLCATIYHTPGCWTEEDIRLSVEQVRELDGWNHAVCIHGDATWSLTDGDDMMEFSVRLMEEPEELKEEARRKVDEALRRAERIARWGTVDALVLCSDYCFNDNPFLPPAMFDEFVTPYLADLIAGYRALGFHTIKHTDGNIKPILDSLVSTNPHALHSLDPQGGVDIAEVKRRAGARVCLIGNVHCGLLQSGTEDQVRESARYALRHGMPGGGYVFGTSNCIYTGMPLERYELMLDVWRKEGNYPLPRDHAPG